MKFWPDDSDSTDPAGGLESVFLLAVYILSLVALLYSVSGHGGG